MTWVFGYGSLVWRPAFAYRRREPGWIEGWNRRFWQQSPDHRGTPSAPGRVVTLVPGDERCWGMAYELDPRDEAATLAALDHREQAGYERHDVAVQLGSEVVGCTIWIAGRENPNFVGSDSMEAMVEQIASRHGPSGPNDEYLLRLAEALRAMGADDPHVFGLEAALRDRLSRQP